MRPPPPQENMLTFRPTRHDFPHSDSRTVLLATQPASLASRCGSESMCWMSNRRTVFLSLSLPAGVTTVTHTDVGQKCELFSSSLSLFLRIRTSWPGLGLDADTHLLQIEGHTHAAVLQSGSPPTKSKPVHGAGPAASTSRVGFDPCC